MRFAAAALLLALPAVVAAAPPALPELPPLVLGQGRSFVVQGTFRPSPSGSVAFHVATDGKRERCAFYDPADGTPLFLSNGRETLIYQLSHSRILRIPSSRSNISVAWEPERPQPIQFNVAVGHNSNPAKLDATQTFFHIDKWLQNPPRPLEHRAPADGGHALSSEREGGKTETVLFNPADTSTFRFTSQKKEPPLLVLDLNVSCIDKAVPEQDLAFPDLKRFPAHLAVGELDKNAFGSIVAFLASGRAWTEKFALVCGPEQRESFKPALPNVDWAELEARDKTLGAAYREALAAQGVSFGPVRPATQPGTQPKK